MQPYIKKPFSKGKKATLFQGKVVAEENNDKEAKILDIFMDKGALKSKVVKKEDYTTEKL